MANQQAIVSIQITDDAGKVAALPLYVQFDNATATLSSIAAAVSVLCEDIDNIIDGKITRVGIELLYSIPGGLKGDPVAGCNVQETGLFSFKVLTTAYRFGIALPSIAAAVQSEGVIPVADDVETWVNRVVDDGTTLTLVEPISANGLETPVKTKVSFRKR